MKDEVVRWLYLAAGWTALGLGVVGVALPLMPTTVFVLIAAFCFARSSERFHRWILSHRLFGPMVRNFREGRGLPRQARFRAVTLIWITMGVSMWVIHAWWAVALLSAIGISLTVYLYRLPCAD